MATVPIDKTLKGAPDTQVGQQNPAQKRDKKDSPRERERDTSNMLLGITILAAAALLGAVLYGYQYSAKGALLAFLAGVLGYAIGGVVGFLFGFPRHSEAAVVQSVEDLKVALANAPSSKDGNERRTSSIRHSTNLERITDWLMTMIIGATVINLKDLSGWMSEQFGALGGSIIASSPGGPKDGVTGAAAGALLVLPFTVAGFLCMYLWARRYLPRAWREADDDLYALARKTEELEAAQHQQAAKQQEQDQQIDKIKTSLYRVDPSVLRRLEETMGHFGANVAAVGNVVDRYRAASSWSDDPLQNLGAAEANGLRLSANVSRDEHNASNPFRVDIRIERVDGQRFAAAVAMLFHNSFDNPIDIETFEGTVLTDTMWISDGFTLGAIVVMEDTRETTLLSLNLESLPNIPAGFVADHPA